MTPCVFCRISKRELPAKIIFEDNHCLAFEDIHPKAPLHLLVIPKRHIESLNELGPEDEGLLGHLTFIAKELALRHGVRHDRLPDGHQHRPQCWAIGLSRPSAFAGGETHAVAARMMQDRRLSRHQSLAAPVGRSAIETLITGRVANHDGTALRTRWCIRLRLEHLTLMNLNGFGLSHFCRS